MTNPVKVLFFANLKEKTGKAAIDLLLPTGASVNELIHVITETFPSIKEEIERALVAVNHEYAGGDTILPDQAEVAIFPQVSGGNDSNDKPTFCRVQNEEIALDEWLKKIVTPTSGAVGMFVGVVRAITPGAHPDKTDYLYYEAYMPMAVMKMNQIASEIRRQWPIIEGIAIVQRCGKMDSGTQSVLIACSAPHRNDGVFEAAHYGIERLKEIVPVWKQETGPDGKVWVEGEYKPAPGE